MSTETGAGATSQFEAFKADLLKSLKDVDAKAPAGAPGDGDADDGDDAKVAAAAADGGAAPGDGDADDAPMAKSMKAVDADGNEVEAIDATEILKSLQSQLGQHEDLMTKSLPAIGALLKSQADQLKAQGSLLKSMQARMDELAGQGRGRKTTLVVSEKPDVMAKSMAGNQAQTVSPQEIMSKCLAAQKAGALTGFDVSRAEVALNNGVSIPADIVAKIK